MKKIVRILLVSLLGFLGCSDGNDGTTTVDKATPVAPWAIIETTTPTYEWTPVQYATRYRLLVQETNQATTIQDEQESSFIDEWYTVEEAGCASEDEGLCMVTPDIEVFEEYTWKVRACVNDECGMWTEEIGFRVTPPGSAGAPRFTDNGDDTVTDNNTKLIWSKNADPRGWMKWLYAKSYCDGITLANHSDWRLPSISELRSLIDKNHSIPIFLPGGHPFMSVHSYPYWSSTTYERYPRFAWGVSMYSGGRGLRP